MPFIPTTPDEIDAAWLSDALSVRHPGARVRGVEVLERHEVTNSHAKLRVEYDEPAGAPETLFCKLLPRDPARRPAIAQTGMGRKESLFYEHLAPGLHMRVPGVHVVRWDEDEGSFILLMEDLAASGCTVSDGPTSVPADGAAAALADLAELHGRFEDPARRKALVPWVEEPSPASSYGAERLQYGLDHHRDKLSDAFAELAMLYIENPQAIHDVWDGTPKTVIHGDAHIGNLFFDHGRIGFLDWGIINVNTPLRDASYFLCMSLSVEDRRKHERDLLKHYLELRRSHGGSEIGFDEAWKTHRLQSAYLVPASCQVVTFPEAASERRKIFAAAFLERAAAAVSDLEVRAALAQYCGL